MDSKRLTPVAQESLQRLQALQRVRVVLCGTSHPGNIGAAARAMKTMGLTRLLLAKPKVLPDEQAVAMASGADDVLAGLKICPDLATALEGCVRALALTARRRELAAEPLWARDAAVELAGAVVTTVENEVALVFGNETSGLSNEELAYCQCWAMIPANPDYASLNLAAAVQVMGYEMRQALLGKQPLPTIPDAGMPATHDEVEGLLGHLQRAALGSGFLDPANPGRLMLRLRRWLARSRLEREEVNILRGLLATFEHPCKR